MESNPGDDEGSASGLSRNKILARLLLHNAAIRRLSQMQTSEQQNVNIESSEPTQPGMAERAIDTATDVSRTITQVSATLQAAVDRLGEAIATARQPGKPLSTVSAITREAPLASLFVAFLFGVAVARRR
jgi:hypothetical protein